MTKEQYKQRLRLHGYRFEGDTVYLDTPYGLWIQRIVESVNGFGLVNVSNPVTQRRTTQ